MAFEDNEALHRLLLTGRKIEHISKHNVTIIGFDGADPYKLSFQVGREKFLTLWLLLVNQRSIKVPVIDVESRYSCNDLHGVTAKKERPGGLVCREVISRDQKQ